MPSRQDVEPGVDQFVVSQDVLVVPVLFDGATGGPEDVFEPIVAQFILPLVELFGPVFAFGGRQVGGEEGLGPDRTQVIEKGVDEAVRVVEPRPFLDVFAGEGVEQDEGVLPLPDERLDFVEHPAHLVDDAAYLPVGFRAPHLIERMKGGVHPSPDRIGIDGDRRCARVLARPGQREPALDVGGQIGTTPGEVAHQGLKLLAVEVVEERAEGGAFFNGIRLVQRRYQHRHDVLAPAAPIVRTVAIGALDGLCCKGDPYLVGLVLASLDLAHQLVPAPFQRQHGPVVIIRHAPLIRLRGRVQANERLGVGGLRHGMRRRLVFLLSLSPVLLP